MLVIRANSKFGSQDAGIKPQRADHTSFSNLYLYHFVIIGRDSETLDAAWKRADADTALRRALRGPGGLSQEEFDKRSEELRSVHIVTDEELKEHRMKKVKMVQQMCSGPDVTEEDKIEIWEMFGFKYNERMMLATKTLSEKMDSGPDVTEEEKTAIWSSFGLSEQDRLRMFEPSTRD
ncbi:hypothetical protein GLAREA_13103 [Glarea lozoyensis ATCC 20868]|uniref:Uncharacterized protein n=1 Tax=Glarea lozoyensis (strain ATCC 20868 / MF5171) TaxID=1116229 RepID=S3CWM0_GLAL2|nr:uncharacterized protein GLAREA_13103 [Glarea lozoyensis ATCC 20868]EPE30055.1 hypothetical protein GLAREA_13103 [Glarea lozoyensis ATCC 20868]